MKDLYLFLAASLFSTSMVCSQDPDAEFHLDETFSPSVTGEIHMSTDDADIFIIGTNRSDVHIKIDRVVETRGWSWGGGSVDVDVSVRNGNLYIEDQETGSRGMIGYLEEEFVIRIEAPRSMSLVARGDDDDYQISGIDGAIKLDIDDGDIEIEDCRGSEFDFDVDDGDVILKGGRGQLTVTIDDGDMHVTNGAFVETDVDIDDGDMYLESTLNDDGIYRFKIDDGGLEFVVLDGGGKFTVRHDDGSVRFDSSFDLVEEDDNYALLTLPGGNASVRISGDDLSVRLSGLKVN